MKTSVVIGAFQFVGFHITKYLLDQGEEVLGMDWEDMSGDMRLEKEMEIGRNSNFLYIPLHKLTVISSEQPKTIYVSCYDLSKDVRHDKQEIIASMLTFITASLTNSLSQVIVLLPIENDDSQAYHSILQVVEENETAKVVFMPTIYGPWQPETMSFEATILQKDLPDIEEAIKAEDRNDALFISDIMEVIIQIPSHHEKKIQLQSEAENQWLQCAKLLWKDDMIHSYMPSLSSRVSKGFMFKVENKTTPIEGISLQKKHVQLLQLMKKWR